MRRKIISIFVLFIILLNSLSLTVFAAEQKYTIESADFLIELDENGNATVTETWSVDYEEGKFSRFFKNIYTAVPEDEDFIISFKEVLVDGIPCVETDDTDSRKDYTYAVVHSSDTARYEIYIHSENETREFQVKYVLYHAVKNVNNEYYLFKFRLLPKGFEKKIERATVKINLPDDCEFTDVHINQGSMKNKGDKATASIRNINDLYKVTVRFDSDGRMWGEPVDKEINNMGFIIPAVLFGAGFVLLIIIIVAVDRKKEKQLRAEMSINPYLLASLYQKWVPHYFTPAEFSWLLTRNRCLSFIIHLAELVHRNIISIDEGYEYITFPKNYGNNSVLRILDESRIYALKKKMETPEDQYYWYLPVVHLEKFFVSNKGFNMLHQLIYTPLSKTKNLKDKVLSQDVKKMQAIARLLHKDKSMPSISFATIAAQYDNSAHYVPYYCFQSQSMVNTDGEDIEDMSVILTTIALATYASHMSSSDTGTSCSSCSSCGGGCGGCGGSD
ncbi:MAG: DUF2207 domain-containing protein [Agathobacter sp.]|nr:DUF2207 domain-containing protein [Agathobacter sp.]